MKASQQSKKSTVKANCNVEACDEAIAIVEVPEEVVECEPTACSYDCAINLISEAIQSLAEIAKDDQLAKDSIANLGVVMLELKSVCNP